jgi:hypothetical protein
MTAFEQVAAVAYPYNSVTQDLYSQSLVLAQQQRDAEDADKREAQQFLLENVVKMRADLSFNTASSDRFYEELEREIDRLKEVLK